MTRIIISRSFFVFVLSIFTLLLLWQDVNARGHSVAQPAEAPAETVTEAEPAQESGMGTGTVTVDGETQSFTVARCSPYIMDSRGMKRMSVDLTTTAETGSLFFLFHQDVYDEARRGGTVRGEDFDIVGEQRVSLRQDRPFRSTVQV